MKKYTIITIFAIPILFFIIDPFNWWPIDHLVGEKRIPCQVEDKRAECTGKIKFFWQ